ncbi:hypothetical protein K5D68_14085 [Pseudomonas cichorii]|nr:hypothetical protein [Pseudomonas cichorii]MBX8587038.1 hypothetical protein [Pseudomonas cichorii]
MSVTPYFHSEALRQRFQRNLRIAQTERRITDEEFRYLQHLCDTEQPSVEQQGSVGLYRPLLEDGSPESLAMVSTLVIECRIASGRFLYVDTLTDGLMCVADRKQLSHYVKEAFSVEVDQSPTFELQRVEGALFEQRMWQIIGHQAQSLRWLAADLQELPSLSQVLGRLLPSKLGDVWSDAGLDLHAPLVQIVEQIGGRHIANRENCIRVQSYEQLAMGILTGKVLPNGQRYRFMGSKGQLLESIGMSNLDLHMADLGDDYEDLIGHYWNHADAHGLTRRHRFAQALADAFSHRVWILQQNATSTKALTRIAASPLYKVPPVPVSRLSLTVDGRGPYKLASLYLIHLERGAYALYSPLKGVRLLKSRKALTDLANIPTGRKELLCYLSLNDRDELPVPGAGASLTVDAYPLDKPLFYDCIDAIIGLQERSLVAALKRHGRDESELSAMLDDALDIRALIDGRLPYIGAGGRWLNEPTDFTTTWQSASVAQFSPGTVVAPAQSWGAQLIRAENTLRDISGQRMPVEVFARQALSPYLAALGYPGPHEGQNIRLTWGDQSICLTDRVLESISGSRRTPIPPDCKVQLPTEYRGVDGLGAMTTELLEPVVSRVATALQASCPARFEAFYSLPLRIDRTQKQVSQTLRSIREHLLRLELSVARRARDIPSSLLDLLQNAVDRPLSYMRSGAVDIYAISITLNGKQFLLGMDVAWALQPPDWSLKSLLFWSPFIGLKSMDSREQLQTWLQGRLSDAEWRSKWLTIFPGEDRQWVDKSLAASATVTVQLERVDGDFLRRMQQDDQQAQGREFAAALRDAGQYHLAPEPFKNSVNLADNNGWLLTWLDFMSIRVHNMLFTSSMPGWLTMAPLYDLERYTELLKEYFRNNDPATDFLAGVPTLQHFARERVLEVLTRDFPGLVLDPDTITVTMTHYSVAPVAPGEIPISVPGATIVQSENLVDFSLNHFSQVQDGVLSISMSSGTPVPAGLNARYVSQLIHDLDVGLHYQTLLAERFDPEKPEYVRRRERFMRQIPPRLLVTAMELKLQGSISQTAFDYLESVLDMPDNTVREPVHGRYIVLRPLALVPRRGMTADKVEGFFLIGPKDQRQGPVLLHIHFSEQFSFREFRDHDHLLAELRVNGPLQELLLSRLEPRLRDRYGNGGLNEAHIPFMAQGSQWIFDTTLDRPEKVSLGTAVVEGNALRHLFEAIVQLFGSLSRKQSVTSAEASWAQFVRGMALLSDVALLFVPGRLGALIAMWQSGNLMRESIDAAIERQWAQALSDFTMALGMMVSTRRSEVESMHTRFQLRPETLSWRNSALSAALRLRLSDFEVLDIELSSLQYDGLYNLYKDSKTQTFYAAIEGKVYRVQQFEGAWRINTDTAQGPKIWLDGEQKWQLDLELGLRGGSPLPIPSEQAMQKRIDMLITVRAEGMKNIRLYSREEAHKINMARFQALSYLKNALFNVNTPTIHGMAKPVQALLKEFFGVDEPTPQMADDVRTRLTKLYVGLSEPSLAPLSSSRFVIGESKSGHESVAAFVLVGDPGRRLFLNDMFFFPPAYPLRDVLPDNRAFSPNDHFRAATMIHEISHQVCDTVDFAYLDSGAPPVNMIDERLPEWSSYKAQLQTLREQALSHRTPKPWLFRVATGRGWRGLQPGDGRIFDSMVRLTGKQTLEEAREVFITDPAVRSRVLLHNADSVAMLASQLGRERFS